MGAYASIWLLDTAGIPASPAPAAEAIAALGGILGVLVVLTIACLLAIGSREWQAGRTSAQGRVPTMPGRLPLRDRQRGHATAAPPPGFARLGAR